MSRDQDDEAIMDDLSEAAEDLEYAARAREKGEQGDSVVDRISAAAKDVIPGDSDPDGR